MALAKRIKALRPGVFRQLNTRPAWCWRKPALRITTLKKKQNKTKRNETKRATNPGHEDVILIGQNHGPVAVQTSRLFWRVGSDIGFFGKNCQNCRCYRKSKSYGKFDMVSPGNSLLRMRISASPAAASREIHEGEERLVASYQMAIWPRRRSRSVFFSVAESGWVSGARKPLRPRTTRSSGPATKRRLGCLASFHRRLSSRFSWMCHLSGGMGGAAMLVLWKVNDGEFLSKCQSSHFVINKNHPFQRTAVVLGSGVRGYRAAATSSIQSELCLHGKKFGTRMRNDGFRLNTAVRPSVRFVWEKRLSSLS